MGYTRIMLDVYTDPGDDKEPDLHVVEVKHIDRLEAEIKGQAMGLPPSIEAAPQHWTTFWAWCALRRVGAYGGSWQDFKLTDCVAVEDHKDPTEASDVPPTNAGDLTPSLSS